MPRSSVAQEAGRSSGVGRIAQQEIVRRAWSGRLGCSRMWPSRRRWAGRVRGRCRIGDPARRCCTASASSSRPGCVEAERRWVAAVLDLAAFYVQHQGGTLRPGQLAAAVEPGRPDAPAPSRTALHGCTPAPRPPPGRPAGLSGLPEVLHVLGCPASRVELGLDFPPAAGHRGYAAVVDGSGWARA
jgi:hypothetical protein